MISTLSGQVKIGDNPQNLDPSSVLELESGNRVLVITRVSTAQLSTINPLPGALVYNTDQECINYYNGTEWINICEALDNSFTVSTRADFLSQINPNAKDSTVVITPTLNPDGSTNYNFEVNQITGANIAPSAVNGEKIQNGSVGSLDLAPGSVTLPKLAAAENGIPGDIIQWNGTDWELVNQLNLGITEKDSIVGNEVLGPTDATLILSGAGTSISPLTLDVADNGITDNELATNAVTTVKIANDAVTSIKIQDGQVTANDIANNAVTLAKMADNSVGTAELVDDSVDADKINANVAGTGLIQAGDGSLQVDNANIAPGWSTLTGKPAGFADDIDDDTTYSAGTGLTLTGTTFAVDNTTIAPDWSTLTGKPAGFADDVDDDTTYSAGTGLTLTGTTFAVDNTTIAPDWSTLTGKPAGFADDVDDDTTY
ncbi:hypothetical protein D2U88_18130, partial [Flagellimonas aequoris]